MTPRARPRGTIETFRTGSAPVVGRDTLSGVIDETYTDVLATTLSVQRRLLTKDPTVTGAFFDDPDRLEGDELVRVGGRRLPDPHLDSLFWSIPDHNLADRIHR